jgi:hypothetical protein
MKNSAASRASIVFPTRSSGEQTMKTGVLTAHLSGRSRDGGRWAKGAAPYAALLAC